MVDENTPESDEKPGESDGAIPGGEPPAEIPGEPTRADKAKLTPGQRLAAKKAQKAVDKRDAKDERKRVEEETRQKEQEEADRILGRAPVEPALPAEVERAASTFSDFMHENQGTVIGAIAAVVLLALGVTFGPDLFRGGDSEQAKKLSEALDVATATVDADAKEAKGEDGKPVFKSEQERADKALAAFDVVASKGDDLTAHWAKLAGGASLVQLGKFDDAQKRFHALADAKDPALAARALEGEGIALEAAGKKEEAFKRYEALAKLDGNKDLGEYHQARIKLQQGDLEGGKTMLKKLYDELSTPAEGSTPSRYLRSEVEVRLSEIDSSLVDKGSSGAGGGGSPQQFSEEQIQRMIEQLQRQQQQGGQE